ncbi:hypothetical protein NUW54_g336 [Trametes sanguinea]|uniref:Uncharacterized protein n=1 Tax=Trametes sanguinea TaxID=158606 RepID=A0ACC1QB77_9APHY|nr:hypothetical protein NUW54_g336 [Trametes sanguinea]
MPVITLNQLKAAYELLERQTASRRAELQARLDAGSSITPEEEAWLDGEANLVDEKRTLMILSEASDYESSLQNLTPEQNEAVARMRRVLEDGTEIGAKRKRPDDLKTTAVHVKKQAKKTKPASEKKENATLAQHIEILDWYLANGKNQTKTAKHFSNIYPSLHLKQPTISAWVKDEKMWRQRWEQSAGNAKAKRALQTQYPAVEQMMDLWLVPALSSNIVLSGEVLRQKWKSFADRCGISPDQQLQLSNGWLDRFKKRHGLREFKRHGEAASASAETVEQERQRIQKLILEHGYQPCDIYNMDETGLFYGLPPDRGLSDKATAGVKGKKVRLTYAFTANATGSDRLPPLVIGKYRKPRAFNNRTGSQLGFQYHHNAKAWMTTVIYQEWIEEWDQKLVAQQRKILLLQDNFSAHIPPETLKAIRVEPFEANLTAHVQPNDQGIIRCFKAHYRAKFIERAINRYDSGVTPTSIYDINQLEAMRLADAAWREVDATTIRHCWRKAGILPDFDSLSIMPSKPTISVASLLQSDPPTPVAQAEKAVENALDSLVLTGALQPTNRMDVNSLLNPQIENEIFSEVSEQEIYEAVQGAEAESGDSNDNTIELIENPPTRREALQAASVILRYASTMDNPSARKVEAALASLTRQMRIDAQRQLKDSSITRYFSKN